MGSASLALSAGFVGKALSTEAAKTGTPKEMPTRILGKTGVPVSILGMGGSIDATDDPAQVAGTGLGRKHIYNAAVRNGRRYFGDIHSGYPAACQRPHLAGNTLDTKTVTAIGREVDFDQAVVQTEQILQ